MNVACTFLSGDPTSSFHRSADSRTALLYTETEKRCRGSPAVGRAASAGSPGAGKGSSEKKAERSIGANPVQ